MKRFGGVYIGFGASGKVVIFEKNKNKIKNREPLESLQRLSPRRSPISPSRAGRKAVVAQATAYRLGGRLPEY